MIPGRLTSNAPAAAAPAPAAAASAPAASAAQAPAQPAIGNIVTAPIARKGIDVLGTPAAAAAPAAADSNEVKVKMPSMFKK
ncbi:MAG: hypothetical protein ABI831_05260 [Betaproteobacteria bacterium]